MSLPATSSPFCCKSSNSNSNPAQSSSLWSPVMTYPAPVSSFTSLLPEDGYRVPDGTICDDLTSRSCISVESTNSVIVGDSEPDHELTDFTSDSCLSVSHNPYGSVYPSECSCRKMCDTDPGINKNPSFFKDIVDSCSYLKTSFPSTGDNSGADLTIARHKSQTLAGSRNTLNDSSRKNQEHYSNGEKTELTLNESKCESGTTTSEKLTESLTTDGSQQDCQMFMQLTLEDLPEEVLLNIIQRLPTVSLIACATAHEMFAGLINDVQFLNMHTRSLLGFKSSEKDITYDAIPAPIAPLHDLWFQVYLYRAAPNMVGLVRPGVIFYDLLCFKHLLDTFILQGIGYKYWMFVSDVIKNSKPPPLSFMKCKRLGVSQCMLHMLTKVAICCQEILLLTVNDFEALSISAYPPSHLDGAWENGVPVEWRMQNEPSDMWEVVSRKHGMALASFFIAFNSKFFVGWSGLIDYSTFRWKDNWSLCRFLPTATLDEIKQICDNFFLRFIDYVGTKYISIHCTSALLFRGLVKLTQQREILLPKVQEILEKTALMIHARFTKAVSVEQCRQLKIFLDGVQFMDSDQNLGPTGSQRKPQPRDSSKTLEVAIQRYLHRYLNQMLGWQVLQFYTDPTCHHVLCITCRHTHSMNPSPFCVERVGPQRIPLKIWPPHLMHLALLAIPALAKFVCLDIQMWRRNLLSKPLSEKITVFVRQVLNASYFDFNMDPRRAGVIAKRLLM